MRWFSRVMRRARGTLGAGFTLVVLVMISVVPNTGFHSPPRYDGAGYAVLGWSLASGLGYREGSHPVAPPHTHFPPGYPLVLSGLIRGTGPSFPALHALSVACTVAATIAYWSWFRRLFRREIAFLLGVALAINWTWGRIGGAIQSEPLFNLLGALTLLAASGPRTREPRRGFLIGLLLAACILTRHVGVCLAAAVILDLISKRRIAVALVALATTVAGIVPWLVWLHRVGRGSQANLFEFADLILLVGRQVLFYTRRIPDQLLGPFVEIATVYAHRPRLASVATCGAVVVTAIILLGWCRMLRSERRRIAGLVPLCTVPLLLAWPFTEAGRFLVPLVPFLLVGAVEGLSSLVGALRVRNPRRWAACLVLFLSSPYPVYAIATGRAEAQRQTHRDFDAACVWIAHKATTPGPVLTHYPADLFWQTGRKALEAADHDPQSIDRLIDRYGVAYLVINESPFTNAPTDPLSRFVLDRVERVRPVWGPQGAVSVYAVTAPERR